jgi:transcription elongation factor Elf1
MIKLKKVTKPVKPNPVFAARYDGTVDCPWCESSNSKLSSPFGSTVSEMIFICGDCGETFGWMKWEEKRDHSESPETRIENESE